MSDPGAPPETPPDWSTNVPEICEECGEYDGHFRSCSKWVRPSPGAVPRPASSKLPTTEDLQSKTCNFAAGLEAERLAFLLREFAAVARVEVGGIYESQDAAKDANLLDSLAARLPSLLRAEREGMEDGAAIARLSNELADLRSSLLDQVRALPPKRDHPCECDDCTDAGRTEHPYSDDTISRSAVLDILDPPNT